MLIDWFTVFAQFINFLILVWLLKRFLYKPILNAINEREDQISEKISNAEMIKKQAEEEREELNNKLKEINEQRSYLFAKSFDEVIIERERLIAEAKNDVAIFADKRREDLKEQEEEIYKKIIQQLQSEVFSIVRKVLKDLSGENLESHVFEVFIKKLSELDEEKKYQIQVESSSVKGEVIVRSSSLLTLKQRKLVEDIINAHFENKNEICFKIVPELFSGIEIIMNGQKLAWSIKDYLASMEIEVQHILNSKKSVM